MSLVLLMIVASIRATFAVELVWPMRVPAAAAKPLASRPLTMAIELTPAVSASRQARSFAIMPAEAVPSAIIRSMPSTIERVDRRARRVEDARRARRR